MFSRHGKLMAMRDSSLPGRLPKESLAATPFHIYDDQLLDIIGDNPTLTLLSHTDLDPVFYKAAV
ncbi:hypothetical protein B0I37DRAFT_417119 [Chaetomium sp. MPI-CAGE-AT-0009]|nr:hypothetical protein B0I37DRAFT_417119 [Chaetomium sp. MPI-CAGE-AT-0009]